MGSYSFQQRADENWQALNFATVVVEIRLLGSSPKTPAERSIETKLPYKIWQFFYLSERQIKNSHRSIAGTVRPSN